MLFQASPTLAQSVTVRPEPRGWEWLQGRATDLMAAVSEEAERLEMAGVVASALMAAVLAEPPAPSPVPPDPPGFSSSAAVASPGLRAMHAEATDVPLVPAWNLASLPSRPVDPSPATVLGPLGASLRKAFAYDACDAADPWKVYDPADPAGSDLTQVDERAGLWLDMAQGAPLPSPGPAPLSAAIHLCPGWNLIGFPSEQSRPVENALSTIAGKYQRVFGYDAADPADPWEVYDVAVPSWANDLKLLRPGHGYWILATAAADLQIVNDGSDSGVEIAQPAQLAEITAPVSVIGTVRGQSLSEWELRYRSLDGGDWVTIAAGTGPVTSAPLGTFDPTLLLNGLYEIELSALDADGDGVAYSTHVVVEGQQKIGHFTLSFLDLEVPLSGIPIRIVRNYDTREKASRDFGYGWTLDVRQGSYRNNRTPGEGWRIVDGFVPCQNVQETLPHLTTVRLSDREVYRFRLILSRQAITAGGCFAEAGFAFVDGPVPGAALSILGSAEVFHANGTSRVVDPASQEPYEPRNVRLQTRDGRTFDLDLAQGLTRLRDTNGNELQIAASAITHSSGKSIAFTRDAQGRITEIADPLGRTLHYAYDAAGDLVTFTDQADRTTAFTYDSGHRLLTIEDPRGIQPIRNDYDADGRLIRSTDAFGKVIELTHDLAAHREVVTDRLGHSRVLEYDDRGNVIRETDALGKITTRTYDGNDLLLSETNPLGHTTRYTWDADRNLTKVEDPLGHTTRYTYNARGKVLTTTDARGKVARNTYDAAGNLLETEDPLGNATSYTYDARGNLLTETDAESGITTFAYDAYGNQIQKTDAMGTVTTSTYDASGKLASRTTGTRTWAYEYSEIGKLVKTTDPDRTITRSVYDALGNLIESIDKLGRSTTHTYDDLGRLTRTQYPDGTARSSTYDAEGRRLTSTDRGGRTTTAAYDAEGRLLTTTYTDGAVVTNQYDDAGRLTATTDARSNTTSLEYDAAGRRTKVGDVLGNDTVFGYDENGNRIAITDARGNTTTYEHDDANRLITVTFADGTSAQTGYDAVGRRISQTDQAGSITRFGYDLLGRLLTVTDALNQVTRYTYDDQSNRTSQADAKGHATRFDYDALGRTVRRTLHDSTSEEMTYDALGRLRSRKDFAGRTTTLDYDTADRLIRRTLPDASSVSFSYTLSGRRQTAMDGRGTTSYTYDSRDRLQDLIYPDGRKLTYSYDANGNRTELTAHVAGQVLTTRFTYDALNRLDQVIDARGRTYDYDYDANGNKSSLRHPNGAQTAYVYDGLNRLRDLTTLRSGQTLHSYAYTLDPAGNRTRIDEHDGTSRSYTYDALYRLIGENVAGGTGPAYAMTFEYDPVGNRLRQTAGNDATAYTYDDRDRLLTENGNVWTWDANGNLTGKNGEADYGWSPEDRLTQVTLADGTVVAHVYDADGNRVRTRITPPNGPQQITDYLVDTSGSLSHVVAETDGSGSLKATYVRGRDLLAVLRASGDRFYHADALGSVRLLTDGTGAVKDRYTFAAFGQLLSHEGEDPNAYLFAGEPLDPNSGFYYNRARWMDPEVGRFESMDPWNGTARKPISLHRYLYADLTPPNATDPSGRFTAVEVALAVLILAVIVVGYLATRPSEKTKEVFDQETAFTRSRDQAAMQAMRSIYPICQETGMEYCGPICSDPNSETCQIGPPPAVQGTSKTDCSNVPHCSNPNTRTVAIYHCHGDRNLQLDEYFSLEDNLTARGYGAMYLLTPRGNMKRYTPWGGVKDLGSLTD
ncbi:MAG TPA: RHS repeat-associated core domain-containing protein [Thermoanaerobaculia bacterium]|nr:RHS repeat-associated core domain-containing protein [Thermoanaerobaculia bacterium]